MGRNRYLVFLKNSGKPLNAEQRVYGQLLYFLDDRHLPVKVVYDDRLPGWIRNWAWVAHVFYLCKLLTAPGASVIIDYALHGRLGLSLLLARRLTRRRIVILMHRPLTAGRKIAFSWLRPHHLFKWLWLQAAGQACLRAAHRVLVPTESLLSEIKDLGNIEGKVRFISQASDCSSLNSPANGFSRWKSFRVFQNPDLLAH